jgi:putative ABC transport system permease protein
VIWLAARQLGSRRLATTATLALLSIAVSSFSLLATTARSTQSAVVGDILTAWSTPYDLLVRPPGSRSPHETEAGLVRPNYASGLHGGITLQQLATIKSVAGVDVAAPLAIVGLANWPSVMQVHLAYPSEPVAVYRVQASELTDANLSSYSLETRYLVVARGGVLQVWGNDISLRLGSVRLQCDYPITCFAPRVCLATNCSGGRQADDPGYMSYILQPVVIAGIDPEAEARIVGLDGCVQSGRYLTIADSPIDLGAGDDLEQIPVLAASDSFIDEKFLARIAPATNSAAVLTGADPKSLSFGPSTGTTATASELYRATLAVMRQPDNGSADPYGLWSVGDVDYVQSGQTLQPISRPANPDILLPTGTLGIGDAPAKVLVPPEAADIWFRRVTPHPDAYLPGPGSPYRFKQWQIVGTYEPRCLRGFAAIAGGNLEAYSAPQATLPNGAELRPNRSVAGYLNSPPLILTTLAGAEWLTDPKRYTGQSGAAPISLVRIKVAGTSSPGAASENRLRLVAADINARTGLIVDIVKGSSTQPVVVNLPAGQHGRPATPITESWFKKGVAIHFYLAASAQSVLIFSVLLLIAGLTVASGSYTTVRRRRSEFALLRATGWSAWRIGWLVEVEVLVLGSAAAGIAMVATAVGGRLLGSGAAVSWLLLPFLAASALAALAGALPAWSAARGPVVSQLRPHIRRGRATVLRAGVLSLALILLRSRRAETGLCTIACALCAALAVTLQLSSAAFQSELDATRLGLRLSIHVDRFQTIAAIEAAVLAIGLVAFTSVLTCLELRKQLAVLRALGWSTLEVTAVASFQGLVIALAGSALGAAILVVIAFIFDIPGGRLIAAIPNLVAFGALTAIVAVSATSFLMRSGRAIRVLRR